MISVFGELSWSFCGSPYKMILIVKTLNSNNYIGVFWKDTYISVVVVECISYMNTTDYIMISVWLCITCFYIYN